MDEDDTPFHKVDNGADLHTDPVWEVSVMTVTKSIREMSEGIEDPRCACDVKIPLYDVLAVSIAAILCGQEELSLAHVSTLVEVLSQADIASLFAAELDA